MRTRFVLLMVGLSSMMPSAHAWSSKASETANDLRAISTMIALYHLDHRSYPSTGKGELAEVLHVEGLWDLEYRPLVDGWGHPFIYRVPGVTGADFDLYAVGPDGIDQQGGRDDVTTDGVIDGYHWKETWPRGRQTIWIGGSLAILTLLLRPVHWQTRLSVALLVFSLSLVIGAKWLEHPGIASRNDRLGLAKVGSTVGFLVGITVLALRANRNGRLVR